MFRLYMIYPALSFSFLNHSGLTAVEVLLVVMYNDKFFLALLPAVIAF